MINLPDPSTGKYGIRIPSALKTQLAAFAAACRLSESQVIEKAIRRFLKIVGQNIIFSLSNISRAAEKYQDDKKSVDVSFRCSESLINKLDALDDNRSRIIKQIIAWRLSIEPEIKPVKLHIPSVDKKYMKTLNKLIEPQGVVS